MDKDKKESSVLPSLGSKGVQANRRPIGQVPSAPPSRSIQINSNVIGAIGPSAKSTLKSTPATWFKDKTPAANPTTKPSLPTTPAPAFAIVPPDSLEEDKASIPERPNRPILEKPSRPAREEARPVKDTTPAHTLRTAAGDAWQDPTLADWDPSTLSAYLYQ